MTPAERITKAMQKELAEKQRQLVWEQTELATLRLGNGTQQQCVATVRAIARIEKSIANRTAKVLCLHSKVATKQLRHNPQGHKNYYHCPDCKGTATSL